MLRHSSPDKLPAASQPTCSALSALSRRACRLSRCLLLSSTNLDSTQRRIIWAVACNCGSAPQTGRHSGSHCGCFWPAPQAQHIPGLKAPEHRPGLITALAHLSLKRSRQLLLSNPAAAAAAAAACAAAASLPLLLPSRLRFPSCVLLPMLSNGGADAKALPGGCPRLAAAYIAWLAGASCLLARPPCCCDCCCCCTCCPVPAAAPALPLPPPPLPPPLLEP